MGEAMPKSLGQIHTVSFNYEQFAANTGINYAHLCDVSGKLTEQFNRQIRQMCNYKIVGIDLVAQLPEGLLMESDRVVCKGRLRYMQPTKGRCDAMRAAYQQLRAQMKTRGIDPSDNKGFDFRVLPRSSGNYPSNLAYDTVALTNNTSFSGGGPLAMIDNVVPAFEVFTTYNNGVQPVVTSQTFSSGLAVDGVTGNDFVVNEGIISQGNPKFADTEMEEIPFELAYDSTARRVTQLNWRPDPALYLSVMTGQFEIVLDEITAAGSTGSNLPAIEIDCAIHVAGWKSFVRGPSSRSRSTKKMKGGKK
jgi:hypothetical protein